MITTDYIELASAPFEEDCAQVGAPNYLERAKLECRLFKRQLEQAFPEGRFAIRRFLHDFGSYIEVVAEYPEGTDEESERAREAALAAESGDHPNCLRWTPEHLERLQKIKEGAV